MNTSVITGFDPLKSSHIIINNGIGVDSRVISCPHVNNTSVGVIRDAVCGGTKFGTSIKIC